MIDKLKSYIRVILSSLKGEETDYTTGNINKSIVLLAIPMILELSMESIFALVDIFWVAKLGSAAIAIVGFTESMSTIIYSIAMGLSTAATAIIARRIGEKDNLEASKAAAQVILLGLLFSVVTGITGYIYAEKLLQFMGATPEAIALHSIYTKIVYGFNIVIFLLFLINGIFRGAGNAAIAMKSLWIASIINIVLDPLLIYGIGSWEGMGITGAAIASCIGRSVGVGYQIYHLFDAKGFIRVYSQYFKPQLATIGSVLHLAWPASLQFIIGSGSWILLTRFVSELGGTDASAGYQIAVRNLIFFLLPAWGLSNAAATLVGQNLGAGNFKRAEESVIVTAKYSAIFMSFVSLFFIICAKQIVMLFTQDPNVVVHGSKALRIMGSGFVFYGVGMVMVQALNGAGDTRTPTLINLIGFWLFQIPFVYLLLYYFNWGIEVCYWAIPIAEGLIGLMAYVVFRNGSWKKVTV